MGKLTVASLKSWAKSFEGGDKSLDRIGDGEGLYLEARRGKTGTVGYSWVMRWRSAIEKNAKGIGKDQSMGLGVYLPHATEKDRGLYVTLVRARDAAAATRKELSSGRDPLAARKVAQDNLAAAAAEASARRISAEAELEELNQRTVGAAIDGWFASDSLKLSSDKHRAQKARRLEEYRPLIGHIPVKNLTRADVAQANEALLPKKTADKSKAGDRIETIRRISADLEKALDWAIARGWRDGENPTTGARKVLPKKPKAVRRRSIDVADVAAYWRAVLEYGKDDRYPVSARLLQLLTLTGARNRELRLMRWEDVEGLDTNSPRINVPADRMKRRERWTCWLSSQAAGILREVQRWQQAPDTKQLKGVRDGLVFVHLEGNYKGRVLSENAVAVLLKRIDWHDDMTGHGSRSLLSTIAQDQWAYHGPNRTEAIEYSLAHVSDNAVRAVYDRNDFKGLRTSLAQWWADYLDHSQSDGHGVVVQLRSSTTA